MTLIVFYNMLAENEVEKVVNGFYSLRTFDKCRLKGKELIARERPVTGPYLQLFLTREKNFLDDSLAVKTGVKVRRSLFRSDFNFKF